MFLLLNFSLLHVTFLELNSKMAKQIKREDIPVWDRLLYEKPRHDLQGLRQEVKGLSHLSRCGTF